MTLKPYSKNPQARDRIGGDMLSSQLRLPEAMTEAQYPRVMAKAQYPTVMAEAQYPTVMAEAQLGTQRTRSAMTSQHDRPQSKDLPFPKNENTYIVINLHLEMWP